MNNGITNVDILDESKECFLIYAEETLTDRAIPAAEDGLLSAQRKILWTMEDYLKMNNKSKTKKCNAVVGATLSTSYFHGDASCYGVLCKMSQDYLMRYPLIAGQGSLGTQENNDMVSSSRYTEAKPSIYADLMMNDFKKNVVPVKETYNSEFMEPVVLPSLFPNALCNGKQAIGISMAHNSAPHNLTEICHALIAIIQNPNITIDEILKIVPGPDFPLGGTILNTQDVYEAFKTGKSKVSLKIRGDYEIKGQEITFTSIPYRTYRNKIREQIEKNIDIFDTVLDDFNDESSIGQNKLVFKAKKGIDVKSALAKLFDLTDLQTTLSYNMNYIVNGTPKLCSILDLMKYYLKHQETVLIKATEYDKQKAEAKAHILEGLILAIDRIDEVIALIRSAESSATAKVQLINLLPIDDIQVKAILDMRLAKLSRMDKEELKVDLEEQYKIIKECVKMLTDNSYRDSKIIEKIESLRDKYGDARRTKLEYLEIVKEKKQKQEIETRDCVATVTKDHVVRISTTPLRNASIIFSAKTNTADALLVFTSAGKVHKLPLRKLTDGYIGTLVDNEKPLAYCTLAPQEDTYVFFITKNGIVKRVPLQEYQSISRSAIKAINLKENDSLVSIFFMTANSPVILTTRYGMVIQFDSDSMPISSRIAQGVKGITLNEGDGVITGFIRDCHYLAMIGKDGAGKRIDLKTIVNQGRGGKGTSYYNKREVAGSVLVNDNSKLLINKKQVLAKDIPVGNRISDGGQIVNGTVMEVNYV